MDGARVSGLTAERLDVIAVKQLRDANATETTVIRVEHADNDLDQIIPLDELALLAAPSDHCEPCRRARVDWNLMLAGIPSVGVACILAALLLVFHSLLTTHEHEYCTHGRERIGIAAFFRINLLIECRMDRKTEINNVKK